ncbi:Histidine phosphatase superfamily clade-2 [Macrophomina phaseolina MS6]|uniref:Phytase A n=1 Tax=Macrophomina phaseolina (strain MS6) TaxID=1126212 RepID=K2RCZ3_MACPH|nr:Histidine phosphatase superfamily clade-2 [Macrophomina phaseolina MS6]
MLAVLLVVLGAAMWANAATNTTLSNSSSCDTVLRGFQCSPETSHFWGQYSPYYEVPSAISAAIPAQCRVTFAQILSRHGARDPTASKTAAYNATIQKIQKGSWSFEGNAAFLQNVEYTLGADELTAFGEQQLYNSGIKFYQRYAALARSKHMFVRASGESRVVASADYFTQGFHKAMQKDRSNLTGDYPYDVLTISEDESSNNTMSHAICTAFENEDDAAIDARGQGPWNKIWLPPISSRINDQLPGANLSDTEVSYLMDLCPFYTVADPDGKLSDFCGLFFDDEWKQYDYYQSLGKYYHYGAGDPLGPTQGVGYVNELIARLTNQPVEDHTSTNRTLDSDPATFPIGPDHVLFADFSHDNDMTAIFFALGLYNDTKPLNNTRLQTAEESEGYSASWTVPFAARLYVEKLACSGDTDEYVRFIVNDRVIPLSCADADGKCKIDAFIDTLTFAQSGGNWGACFG